VIPARMSTHTGDPDGASMTTATGVFDLMLSDALSLDLLVRRRWAQSEFDAFAFDFTTFQEIRTDDGDLEIARNDLDLARLGATWRWGEAATLLASAGLLETDRAQADDGVETDAFEGERRFVDLTFAVEREAFELVIGAARETEEIDAVQFGSPIVAEQDQVGVFAALTGRWGIADVTGAVRVDEYDGFGSETTWRVGVNVRPLAGVRIYGAYGVSFRAPSLYERFTFFGSPGLAPEEGETWEFGADAKYAVFGQDEGLALSLVYRSSDLTDMIDFGPAFTYVNIDEAELESAQARVRVRPLSWLQGEIAYVYTDARDAVSDAPLLRRPENAWRASLEGDWGALRGTLSWRRVGERADILYADDGVFIGTGVTPAYDVVRASLAFDVADGASVSIAADNLFDEAYEPANAFAGAPRSVMVRLRLSP